MSTPFISTQYPVMPNLAQSTANFMHTIDSAVHVLDALGISESRLTIRMAGPGHRALKVVRQSPPSGTPLTPSVPITLWISGFGFFEALPMPMREAGGEAEIGTRELCQVFDDPLQKTAQWFRAGAPLFEIGPDKYAACRRWLALFGFDPSAVPEEMLYPLALLAPTLAKMAGREIGIRLAFLILLDLPVYRFHYSRSHRFLEPREHSRLGIRASRLGRDFLVGDRQIDTDALTIQIGPVSLETYSAFQSDSGRRLLRMAMDMCASAYQACSVAWIVEDARQAPRLGIASKNSRLGLNFHLGKGAQA